MNNVILINKNNDGLFKGIYVNCINQEDVDDFALFRL